jgi:hypothetical protein
MHGTIPQPPPGGDPLAELRHEVILGGLWSDETEGMLERRIARLEEIQAARWPRRILVRRRLARDLRASVAGYAWIDGDWADRRAQSIGDGWPVP